MSKDIGYIESELRRIDSIFKLLASDQRLHIRISTDGDSPHAGYLITDVQGEIKTAIRLRLQREKKELNERLIERAREIIAENEPQ